MAHVWLLQVLVMGLGRTGRNGPHVRVFPTSMTTVRGRPGIGRGRAATRLLDTVAEIVPVKLIKWKRVMGAMVCCYVSEIVSLS
jgi:hypothetical protein